MNGKIVDANSLNDVLSRETYLIQERIAQHEKMSRLNPSSVNTIRLVTCYRGETIEPFSAGVRLGREGNVTDNWHKGGHHHPSGYGFGKARSIRLHASGIQPKKVRQAIRTQASGLRVLKCRITGRRFIWRFNYTDIFYCTYSIGWDIAITPSGPLFIEGNYGWDPLCPCGDRGSFPGSVFKILWLNVPVQPEKYLRV